MLNNALHLVHACLAMVLLTLAVGAVMLSTRIREMRLKRIHPQAAATSATMGARLENVQPADNFKNLFEVPVLFYCLVAVALAVGRIPDWLITGCWWFVALRVLHSVVSLHLQQGVPPVGDLHRWLWPLDGAVGQIRHRPCCHGRRLNLTLRRVGGRPFPGRGC